MGRRVNKGKEKVSLLLKSAQTRAKDSLKLLELIETQTLSRAKRIVTFSNLKAKTQKTNTKILESLQRIGVATQNDVVELKARIAELEQELHQLRSPKTDA